MHPSGKNFAVTVDHYRTDVGSHWELREVIVPEGHSDLTARDAENFAIIQFWRNRPAHKYCVVRVRAVSL